MAIRKKIVAGTLAALALAATTAGAFAAPAYATAHVNVRSGPGTQFRVVDVLSRGERVDIEYCRGSWCFVEKSGPDGWVSANYLNRGRPDRPHWDRPDRPDRPDWDRPGWDRPHWGDRPDWDRPRPPRPPMWNPRPPRPPFYPGRPDNGFCFSGPNGYVCIDD